MAMTSLSIVLTVFVLQLHHVGPHQKPVPKWIRKTVINYIAKVICMRNHLSSYYCYNQENIPFHSDEMYVLSCKRTDNCNGRIDQCQLSLYNHQPHSNLKDQHCEILDHRISKHLKILFSKQDSEDDYQHIVNEWRLVAHIMDRFLFWAFLSVATFSSLVILVIRPMMKPSLLPSVQ